MGTNLSTRLTHFNGAPSVPEPLIAWSPRHLYVDVLCMSNVDVQFRKQTMGYSEYTTNS